MSVLCHKQTRSGRDSQIWLIGNILDWEVKVYLGIVLIYISWNNSNIYAHG